MIGFPFVSNIISMGTGGTPRPNDSRAAGASNVGAWAPCEGAEPETGGGAAPVPLGGTAGERGTESGAISSGGAEAASVFAVSSFNSAKIALDKSDGAKLTQETSVGRGMVSAKCTHQTGSPFPLYLPIAAKIQFTQTGAICILTISFLYERKIEILFLLDISKTPPELPNI
jgi:hypothetical protein